MLKKGLEQRVTMLEKQLAALLAEMKNRKLADRVLALEGKVK